MSRPWACGERKSLQGDGDDESDADQSAREIEEPTKVHASVMSRPAGERRGRKGFRHSTRKCTAKPPTPTR